jgi:hypothetical protein
MVKNQKDSIGFHEIAVRAKENISERSETICDLSVAEIEEAFEIFTEVVCNFIVSGQTVILSDFGKFCMQWDQFYPCDDKGFIEPYIEEEMRFRFIPSFTFSSAFVDELIMVKEVCYLSWLNDRLDTPSMRQKYLDWRRASE